MILIFLLIVIGIIYGTLYLKKTIDCETSIIYLIYSLIIGSLYLIFAVTYLYA